ncbi:ExbD/TolR family protein [Devosia sp. Root635]|uniref:ExbD/TolR family protein n=1 Tax=Devosia sp. Root635 TaxID=1736575 RepID=UPI0006FE6EFE|nr:biopolymer transporter ExbD [Devosia sp. Root635]KRA53065.1 hypothetical protein ASD80_13805 [Devosia sp. Root635]
MTILLPAPRRRRSYFMLTPLVDVMFLLLIFFMLSSETALYTLLRLTAQTVVADESAAPAAAPGPELLVSIGRSSTRVNGVATPISDLAETLARYKASGIATAALVAGNGAEAQDIVAVIELFEAAEFGQVRLIANAAAAP